MGKHLLGAHVVGQRVVVRRRLRGRGPTGGPALTDVLGTCLTWDDAERYCVIAPEQGEPVRIPLGEIVSGKPVPPRPSARLRVGAREAQERASALFPRLRTTPLGPWTLRHEPASTSRRANSALAFGPSGDVDPALVEELAAFYRERDLPPLAAVEVDGVEEELLRGLGWVEHRPGTDAVLALASVARAARAAPSDLPPARIEPVDGLTVVRVGDDAVGNGVVDRDWLGIGGVSVAEPARGRGLGMAVVAALLEWGAEQGATTAYLQVQEGNEVARRLYAGLGFVDHHRYRYLTPGS